MTPASRCFPLSCIDVEETGSLDLENVLTSSFTNPRLVIIVAFRPEPMHDPKPSS